MAKNTQKANLNLMKT